MAGRHRKPRSRGAALKLGLAVASLILNLIRVTTGEDGD